MDGKTMLIGVLAIAVAVLGYLYYYAQQSKVKIDLPPGTYPFFCSFHQSLGMTGTLTVK